MLCTGMIMKITRSTSRISINGTTFISETTPRLPPTNIPMAHLVRLKCLARRTSHPGARPVKWPTCESGWGKPRPYEKLLTGFELGGDQANLVDTGAAHDVNGAGDVHEQYIVVAFDESNFLSA